MSLYALFLSLAVILMAFALSAQDTPAPSSYRQPILHMCSDKNPPPCIDKPPMVIREVDPAYPKNARKLKGQGAVVLEVVVDTDGSAHDVHVTGSLGPGFDEEAVKAVKQWKFKPATSDGKAVPASISVHVAFRCAKC